MDAQPTKTSSKKKITLIITTLFLAALVLHVLYERNSERAWNEYKAAAAARGEPVEWQLKIPTRPPDAENFYGSPLARKWMPKKNVDSPTKSAVISPVKAASTPPKNVVETKPSAESKAGPPRNPFGLRLSTPGSLAELKALPKSGKEGEFTLESYHTWLEQWNDEFEEFRAASKRPSVYLEGDYSSPPYIPIQNFVAARTLAQMIASKAKVNLLLGHPDAALKDLESLGAVIRGMESKPTTLIAAMIRTAMAGLYYNVAQEGITANLWNPEQLKSIQDYTGNFDILTSVYSAMMDGERTGILTILEEATSMKGGAVAGRMMGPDEGSKLREVAGSIFPRGWIRQNQLYVASVMDDFALVLDAKNHRYHPDRGQQLMAKFSKEITGFHPTRLFAAVAIPNFNKAYETCARNQTFLELTAVACGLEQFKAAKSSYPEKLTDLSPTYVKSLPRDIVSGQPVSYKRIEPTKFVLYAVGSDNKDNGGDPKNDWVWGQ